MNLYGWTMSQNLDLGGFKWVKETTQFIKDFTKRNNDDVFIEANVQSPEKLHEVHNDLPFLPERMKIEKVEKFVANLHDKKEYVIYTRSLKQELNIVLVSEKWIDSLNIIKTLH